MIEAVLPDALELCLEGLKIRDRKVVSYLGRGNRGGEAILCSHLLRSGRNLVGPNLDVAVGLRIRFGEVDMELKELDNSSLGWAQGGRMSKMRRSRIGFGGLLLLGMRRWCGLHPELGLRRPCWRGFRLMRSNVLCWMLYLVWVSYCITGI